MKIVLQKFIADSGYCSRRQAEGLIKHGQVYVNNIKAELGARAGAEDEIKIKGKKISLPQNRIYIKLNKPIGYVCTNALFKGEKSVFDIVSIKEKLFVVGRLDKNSRGLVLLTNDGEWANKLTHPRYEHEKEYEVVVKLPEIVKEKRGELLLNNIINKLERGIDIGEGDGIVGAKRAKYLGQEKFKIILTEGKKRQIRRMFRALGLRVEDLSRVRIGNIKLDKLKEGDFIFLDKRMVGKE